MHDLFFLLGRRIADADFHHERSSRASGSDSSFLLDRILRGGHEERLFQRIRLSADGDVPLGHRFQHADCVFGAARLISSASTRLANTGPGRNIIDGPGRIFAAAQQARSRSRRRASGRA